ncbi:response regulator [Mesoterricola silvestris]|nr:response regulator [Mesoterricola silvestris]
MRILLVDDQQLILLGLERMLRRMRNLWEVVAAESGRKALELLEVQPFDVLVTDLNMPGYSGVQLLEWGREHHPEMIRIVLSGHQETAMLHGAARLAHRFLTKPSEPGLLLATLVQVSEARDLGQADAALFGTVTGMGQLPGSPVTAHRVRRYLEDPSVPAATLGALVCQDPGLSAKVLQLVNSAFYGPPRATVDPWEAAQLLGREELADLLCDPAPPDAEARLKPLRESHLRAARLALAITRAEGAPAPVQDLAYCGGLLSAVGPMILALARPGTEGQDGPGISRLYLALLGLPAPLLDLVGNLETPGRAQLADPLAMAAVHVAAGLGDDGFLAGAGLLNRVPGWRNLEPAEREFP